MRASLRVADGLRRELVERNMLTPEVLHNLQGLRRKGGDRTAKVAVLVDVGRQDEITRALARRRRTARSRRNNAVNGLQRVRTSRALRL